MKYAGCQQKINSKFVRILQNSTSEYYGLERVSAFYYFRKLLKIKFVEGMCGTGNASLSNHWKFPKNWG